MITVSTASGCFFPCSSASKWTKVSVGIHIKLFEYTDYQQARLLDNNRCHLASGHGKHQWQDDWLRDPCCHFFFEHPVRSHTNAPALATCELLSKWEKRKQTEVKEGERGQLP